MKQINYKPNDPNYPFLDRQYTGWLALHDCSIAGNFLAAENEFWRDDMRFLPYWKPGLGITSKTPEVLVSAHLLPGRALLWIMNTAHEDRTAVVQLDLRKLGLHADRLLVFDAETDEPYALRDGTLTITVAKRLWKAVRLVEPALLRNGETFVAHFDRGEAGADEALGHKYPRGWEVPAACAPGVTGQGMWLDNALTFDTRHHLNPSTGAVSWKVLPAQSDGTLLALGNDDEHNRQCLELSLRAGKVVLELINGTRAPRSEAHRSRRPAFPHGARANYAGRERRYPCCWTRSRCSAPRSPPPCPFPTRPATAASPSVRYPARPWMMW